MGDEDGLTTSDKLFEEVKLGVGLELQEIQQDVPLLGNYLEREIKDGLSRYKDEDINDDALTKNVLAEAKSLIVDCSDYNKASTWLKGKIDQTETELEKYFENVRNKSINHNKDAEEYRRTIHQIDNLRWSRTLAIVAEEQTTEFLKTGETRKDRLVAMMEIYSSDGDGFEVRALCPSCTRESKIEGDKRSGVEQDMIEPTVCACGECAMVSINNFLPEKGWEKALRIISPIEDHPVTLISKELNDETVKIGGRGNGECLVIASFEKKN